MSVVAVAVVVACLFWFVCILAARAWRGLVQPSTEDGGQPVKGTGS